MACKIEEAYENVMETTRETAKAKGLELEEDGQTLNQNIVKWARIVDRKSHSFLDITLIEMDEEEFKEVFG